MVTMGKNIQIATLRDKYEHVIKVDRTFGSDEIILVVIAADLEEKSEYKEKIEQNIEKIRNYTELVQSKLGEIETINLRDNNTFYEIISKCIDIILKHYQPEDKMVITFTEGSFTLNGALHYAATIVKSFYNIDLIINITEEIGGTTISHIQEQLITSSIWSLISTKDKTLILDCIQTGMNVEEMALVLDVSPGTISNWIHQLVENDIIELSKRDRKLTNLGKLVSKITERERVIIFTNKYEPIISKYLEEGQSSEQIAKKFKLPVDKITYWIDTFPDESVYESIRKELTTSERYRMIKLLLELKKEEN